MMSMREVLTTATGLVTTSRNIQRHTQTLRFIFFSLTGFDDDNDRLVATNKNVADTMTTQLFSVDLLRRILASIPSNFEQQLHVRVGEPNTLQLLKLAIRAFFHNILKFPHLEIYGNDLLKAIWLMVNKQCAISVFEQYNYMDYYPFVDDSGGGNSDFIPPFVSNLKLDGNVVTIWNLILESLPYYMAANESLKQALLIQRNELLSHMQLLADTENENNDNLHKHAVRTMFDVGEYNCTLNKFVDIFVPIDRSDEDDIYASKANERDTDLTKANKPIFSDQTMCLMALSGDGSKILTILSESDKQSIV